ncbi:MAG: ABC transporter permease [Balneolaceae bacterium]|nr:ABC transporter permease [Balneolaceae bacterium]
MIKNYIKIAIRTLGKKKLYSAINIFGLALGVAVCLVIFLFIQDEYSFDEFHTKSDRIYRLEQVRYETPEIPYRPGLSIDTRSPDGITTISYLPLPLGPTLQAQYPEIKRAVRVDYGNAVLRRGTEAFEESITYVDSTFLKTFSFSLLRGNPELALNDPNAIVLREDMAKKYFGDTDPIGRELAITLRNDEKLYTVAGVAENPPSNSSLPFDVLIRIENRPYYEVNMQRWNSNNTPLFLEFAPGADIGAFKKKLDQFTRERFQSTIDDMRSELGVPDDTKVFELAMTPLTGIHLNAAVNWPNVSNPLYSYILGGIALLILGIACINYVTLALARSSGRAREVGIRKSSGARRGQIATQFWGETQLLTVLAMLIGVGLAELSLPHFNEMAGKSLEIDYLRNIPFLSAVLGITLLTGFIAGSYPALVLARYNPVKVLKGSRTVSFKPKMTKALLVLQYSLSIFLIVSSLIMYRQLDYVSSKNIGYNADQLLFIPTHTGWTEEGTRLMERFREELRGTPGIEHISGMAPAFTRGYNRYGFRVDGVFKSAVIYYVDHKFIETMGIELLKGRDFSKDRPTDKTESVIVNEALVDMMDWEDPVGRQLPWKGAENPSTVIGVVRDFHFQSLESPIDPMLLHMDPEHGGISGIAVKLQAGAISETLPVIQETWESVAPLAPFDYWFQDEAVARQYEAHRKWLSIMGGSTFLAILIASMGLFGLAGITVVNKTREIGIRKVLGARLEQILLFLNRDLVKLVGVSLLLAGPVSWYVMQQWLIDFAYHIEIKGWVFLVSALAVLGIAGLTVSYHSVKASLINPAESLKHE